MRKFLYAFLICYVVFGMGAFVYFKIQDNIQPNYIIKFETYEVRVGDTLWDIVKNVSLKEVGNVIDVREVVYDIMMNNNISKNGIYIGQVISIPTYIPITEEVLHTPAKEVEIK